MANIMKMLKQAQDMQKNMDKMKGELAQREVEFTSGGGMVTAIAKGDGSLCSIKINPQVVDPADVEMLEDLVLAACEGALHNARQLMAEEMGKLTKGINIPGMDLPF